MKTLSFCMSVALICSVLGCNAKVNPYSQTYLQSDWAPPIKIIPYIIERDFTDYDDVTNQAKTWVTETHRENPDLKILGFASCYDTSDNRRSLIKQAQATGANVVLLFKKPGARIQKTFRFRTRDKPKTTTVTRSGSGYIDTEPQSSGVTYTPRGQSTTSRFTYNETETIHHPQTYTTHRIPYTEQMYNFVVLFAKH